MFYISRYIGSAYGLWDTDHCTEERVKSSDLLQLYCAGEEVLGLTANAEGIKTVRPYQEPDTVTAQQVKASIFWHVNTTLFGQFITNLVWDSDKITTPVRVRLSSLGEICADHMLYGNGYSSDSKVTLVLDNAIHATMLSFDCSVSPWSIGTKYDMSEVTRQDLEEAVYNNFVRYPSNVLSVEKVFSYIIDVDEDRKLYYMQRRRALCSG